MPAQFMPLPCPVSHLSGHEGRGDQIPKGAEFLHLAGEPTPDEIEDDGFVGELLLKLIDGQGIGAAPLGGDSGTSNEDEETPTTGPGAIARWIGLVDHAVAARGELERAMTPHPCTEKRVCRAVRSVFLYEHQMAPGTRRRAREVLWRRSFALPLPSLRERALWERCRCSRCGPRAATSRPRRDPLTEPASLPASRWSA